MRKSEQKNKKKSITIILLSVVALIVLAIGLTMVMEYNSSGEGDGEIVVVEINEGESSWDIATKLQKQGLIKYRTVFLLKTKMSGVAAKLRYGTFSIEKGAGLSNVIEDLISGGAQKNQVMFTVPEGYTVELIAAKLEKEGICSKGEFLQAAKGSYDYWFLDSVPINAEVKYRLQGFLYPETYAISEDMSAEDIVRVMLNQFGKVFTEDMKRHADKMGKTVFEVVTEASIIERETMKSSEKATVAGVIANRLDIGMKLEMCPTALYPITDGIYDKDTVTEKDTEVDSPYNTYMYKGLPVGPISSPDVLSLKAVLEPEIHDYLFYHTDPNKKDGSHIFTKTYQEHLDTQ